MIFSIAAAVFVSIGRRMYNLCNINKTDFNPADGKLRIFFSDGDEAELTDPDQIGQFQSAIDPFVLEPDLPPPKKRANVDPPETEATDDSEADVEETDESDSADDEETETDSAGEQSALEQAGIPADLAALLHAGGIDTVEAAIDHPDLSQIDGIGPGRRDKILTILTD